MIERNNGYKKGEDGASREFIVTRSALLQKKSTLAHKKEREERDVRVSASKLLRERKR